MREETNLDCNCGIAVTVFFNFAFIVVEARSDGIMPSRHEEWVLASLSGAKITGRQQCLKDSWTMKI
jgi:hypothetical protein